MDRRELGLLGESFAAAEYEKDGYAVVARNYHSRYGEIDIIAQGNGCIVFAEVKLRKSGSVVSPAEAVTYNKQCKLIVTAEKWLSENQTNLQPRFDVVQLWHDAGRIVTSQRIENAFQLN